MPNRRSLSDGFIRVATDQWSFEDSSTGRPFVPLGCNYYDARTGWPPQVWTHYNKAAVRQHFRMMEDLGFTAIRVWLQWSVFMPTRQRLSAKAVDTCRELLSLAREAGIRVNLTGPEFWEGSPQWLPKGSTEDYQHIVSPPYQEAHAEFWELFGAAFAAETTIYAFDLVNEPFVPWDGKVLRRRWNRWISNRYGSVHRARKAWGVAARPASAEGEVPPPPNRKVPGSLYLLDYQTFREEMALEWIERTVRAIRRTDPHHLITVGFHQSSCPLEEIIPSRYTAFNPHMLARCLDYVGLHWYAYGNPLTAAYQPYDLPSTIDHSLSMFIANCRYSYAHRPVIMEEFSYYGGGSPRFWGGVLPHRTEEEQDEYSRLFVQAADGSVGGWLNWPLQDTKGATDTSAYGGLFDSRMALKPWGKSFRKIVERMRRLPQARRKGDVVLMLPRGDLLTDASACAAALARCLDLHRQKTMWDFDVGEVP